MNEANGSDLKVNLVLSPCKSGTVEDRLLSIAMKFVRVNAYPQIVHSRLNGQSTLPLGIRITGQAIRYCERDSACLRKLQAEVICLCQPTVSVSR